MVGKERQLPGVHTEDRRDPTRRSAGAGDTAHRLVEGHCVELEAAIARRLQRTEQADVDQLLHRLIGHSPQVFDLPRTIAKFTEHRAHVVEELVPHLLPPWSGCYGRGVIQGFSHAQLVVRDVSVSAPWYCTVLGLEQFVAGETASGPYVGLRHPTARFVIGMQTATPDQARALHATAIDHLSFGVADRATLDHMRVDLLARGIDVGDVFEEAISFNARIRDPDGLVLELSAPKR